MIPPSTRPSIHGFFRCCCFHSLTDSDNDRASIHRSVHASTPPIHIFIPLLPLRTLHPHPSLPRALPPSLDYTIIPGFDVHRAAVPDGLGVAGLPTAEVHTSSVVVRQAVLYPGNPASAAHPRAVLIGALFRAPACRLGITNAVTSRLRPHDNTFHTLQSQLRHVY